MKLNIDIPDEILNEAAQKMANEAFIVDRYSGSGFGLQSIRKAVMQAVESIDFHPLVAEQIPKILPGVIEEVLQLSLTDLVRKKVKEMRANGELNEIFSNLNKG